jgi:hypothetical protein
MILCEEGEVMKVVAGILPNFDKCRGGKRGINHILMSLFAEAVRARDTQESWGLGSREGIEPKSMATIRQSRLNIFGCLHKQRLVAGGY